MNSSDARNGKFGAPMPKRDFEREYDFDARAREIELCAKTAAEARKEELGKIHAEITQMRQIADPEVRGLCFLKLRGQPKQQKII